MLVGIVAASMAAASVLVACADGAPGATPTPAVTATAEVGSPMPSAFLTFDPAYATAMLWTLDYHLLAVFADAEWSEPGPATAVVAGSLPHPPKNLAFAFLERGPRRISLIRFAEGQLHTVRSFDAPTGIAGSVPAGFALVGDFVQGESLLYLIDLRTEEAAAAAEIVWRQAGPPAIPVAVRLDGPRPVEVLFSTGREPSFPRLELEPPFGLQSLWLETGVVTRRVAPDVLFLGASPDLTWYAVRDPSIMPPQLEIRRYDGSVSVVFPPHSGSRALGRVVFSPEGRFAAWPVSIPSTEDPDRTQISIASTTGGVPLSLSPEQLVLENQTPVRHPIPVGWLDEQNLLLQVEVEGEPQVVRIRSDGSGATMAGQGVFVSLVYR